MPNYTRVISILSLIFIISFQACGAYEAPGRQIELRPYIHFLSPSDMMKREDGRSFVKEEGAFGFGIKIRTQLSGSLGFFINSSITGTEAEYEAYADVTLMTTVGPYYFYELGDGGVRFELGYGYISVADHTTGVFLPAIEYSHGISDRVRLSVEFGLPVANDWFHDYTISENVGTLAISVGTGFVF